MKTTRKAWITESSHGSLRVEIVISAPYSPGRRDWRAFRGEAYRLAAEAEFATLNDAWVISVENPADNCAIVVFELVKATKAEAERALAVARYVLESKALAAPLEERAASRLA
jgi:hypothetical protein